MRKCLFVVNACLILVMQIFPQIAAFLDKSQEWGSETSFGTKHHEVKWCDSIPKSSKFMGVTPRHKRSKSESCRKVKEDSLGILSEVSHLHKLDTILVNGCTEPMKKQSPKIELQSSLKQEILQLEKRLKDQFLVRNALEKALGGSFSHDSSNENLVPKPAKALIKEIAVLELEVVHLEQYLLSLYRIAFDQQISSLSPHTTDDRLESPIFTKKENRAVQSTQMLLPQDSLTNPEKEQSGIHINEKLVECDAKHTHSLLSRHSPCSSRVSSSVENLAKAVRSCHSQPLSFSENAQSATTSLISLAEHLGTRIADHIPETPNRLSEHMIKCIAAIYCKLADPPTSHQGLSSSPISSVSSISEFCPQDQCDIWSPGYRKDSSFDARLENPFNVKGLKEFSGPYSTMVEVPIIYRDSQKLKEIDDVLQNYRSFVCRLEEVDPRNMKHEEKLAFWINIHNALVMHAFLAYGVPKNSLKRVALLLKAAYNVGGHTITTDMIQSYILGCRMSRPGQWLFAFYSPRTKLKAEDIRKTYATDHAEPLLHFALCSGSHSDAAVRAYTPKRVLQELEAAKEEYIRANFGACKDQKIVLPKMLESYAKDLGLCPVGVIELIQQCMPESLRKTMKRFLQGKSQKCIQWIPHNFSFRYLISKELVN